jgi:Fe-S-cluster-containing hydrogenase component 2
MCEFCTKHGEGKKWYLNAKNYSDDLLSDIKRREFNKDFFYWVDRTYKKYFTFIKNLPLDIPIIGPSLRTVIKRIFIYEHWGQVIPIEDVEKVLSITNSITKAPCICRKTTSGKEIRTCFLISLGLESLGIADLIDQSFFGGPDVARFEKVDKAEALNFIKEQEKKGMCHTIWTLKAPFIGALCNCDDTGCIAMKMNKKSAPIFFKAEYVINVDRDKCVGCKLCINICPFKALGYDGLSKKIKIDYRKCAGCGVCRITCNKGALFLRDRRFEPIAANLWY